MAGREKRKRRKQRARRRDDAEAVPQTQPAPPAATADVAPATQAATAEVAPRKSKDDIARESLVPLREGERSLAVTIAAIVAMLLVLGWLVALIAGRSNVAGAAPLTLLLVVAAVGMWRSRYWAVLGFQVLLAITLVNAILFLVLRANAALDVVVGVVIVVLAGTLFWFLVRALARIQMPDRRTG
jgi:hypothetical protein